VGFVFIIICDGIIILPLLTLYAVADQQVSNTAAAGIMIQYTPGTHAKHSMYQVVVCSDDIGMMLALAYYYCHLHLRLVLLLLYVINLPVDY